MFIFIDVELQEDEGVKYNLENGSGYELNRLLLQNEESKLRSIGQQPTDDHRKTNEST